MRRTAGLVFAGLLVLGAMAPVAEAHGYRYRPHSRVVVVSPRPVRFYAPPVRWHNPGGEVWLPGHYNRWGRWIPGHWASR